MTNVEIVVTPKKGKLSDIFKKAENLGLKDDAFGDYVKQELDKCGLNFEVVAASAV